MRKKSTRLLSAALAACMMLSVLPVGAFAAEPGTEPENGNGASAQADPVDSEVVEINDTNFPDPDFQKYVNDKIDTADTTSGKKDGKLSQAERDAVTEISITNTNCTDLTGIAYFANLKILYCSDNKLTGLDMSGNPALEQLLCYENNLESLNVTKNTNLSTLKCQHNGLKELNLEYNENLTELNCSYNQLTTLDVSKNAKLRILKCYNNGMEKLNLGDITQLTLLNCDDNNLTELDVSKNPNLEDLECRENKLRRVVIGKKYSLTTLYLRGNQLTSLDLSGTTREIWNLDDLWQRRAIDVDENGTFDLSSFLPEGFDEDKASAWLGCDKSGSILKVNSHRVRYLYNTGSTYNKQKRLTVILSVNQHKYQWKYDNAKHWRTCELDYCLGLTDAQKAEAPHVYDNAKDNDCNTCGYVRPLYTVTTVNATAKLEDKVLDAPVAAGTEVTLTAGGASEGKTFAGWKLYKVVSDTESEITDKTELANLLKNGTETTATLTMPAYNVKAEPYYSNIPYNIKAVNCTVDKTEAAKGDTVTATRRKPEANERFTGWTVKVGGEEQKADTFLTPDENDPAKVRFTMPAENVEIKANFEGNPTLNIGDHVTANIDGSDASVPSGSTVPVDATVHLTAIAPDGQHFTGWTVKVGGEEQKADTFLTPDKNDPTKATFTMPSKNVEVTANFASNPTLNPTLRVGDHVTATIDGIDTPVQSGSPLPEYTTVHLTATVPEGQHFTGWTVKVNGVKQDDPTNILTTPDENDPTKVTFTMPDANVEVTATFADDSNPEEPVDPVGPSDTDNIDGAISAVVIGAAAGVIAYEAGTGIYRVINMPGIPMPSNRIELAELLWEHAGKPEPVSTALYSDIDEGDIDAQKAARWAVEQDLMKDDADNNKFHPAFPVSKLRTCLTWNAAKEKGLFDKTEE